MKRKTISLLIGASCILLSSLANAAEAETIPEDETEMAAQSAAGPETEETDMLSTDELADARAEAWEAYAEAALADGTMDKEFKDRVMSYGDVVMKFTARLCKPQGDAPENGYPVYIALHGGGQSDTPYINDSQWRSMQRYYDTHLQNAIYVTVRGVRDTWDTHFNPESYPLYDRLIRMLILEMNADPNRVYLEGFSAGGDGVYAISPRMADRFAAVNMSAGHPNGVNFLNMRNLPIQLQVGEYDDAYGRNLATVEYDDLLNSLQETYGGFEHRTLVHADCGHNFADYDWVSLPVMTDPQAWRDDGDRTTEKVDSYPPSWLETRTRDPLPEKVCWNLATRADSREVTSFYYLRAPFETNEGEIIAAYDRQTNTVTLETKDLNGGFSVLLNEEMVDFDSPVTFVVNGEERTITVTPVRSVLEQTTAERGDPNYQFEAEVAFEE